MKSTNDKPRLFVDNRVHGLNESDLQIAIQAAIQKEREACAKIAEEYEYQWGNYGSVCEDYIKGDPKTEIAEMIRARSK